MAEEVLVSRSVVWSPAHTTGIEHLTVETDHEGVRARSVVVTADAEHVMRLDYNIVCDTEYRVRKARLFVDGGRILHLLANGTGAWTDWAGMPIPALDGCIDIDISATPFTNTLPIRRLQWIVGQSEVLRMAYVKVPTLTLSVELQRYTCLEKSDNGARFRFESLNSGFTADLPVDSDGLVKDYPGLFRRLSPL
jgi:hypothetical protein